MTTLLKYSTLKITSMIYGLLGRLTLEDRRCRLWARPEFRGDVWFCVYRNPCENWSRRSAYLLAQVSIATAGTALAVGWTAWLVGTAFACDQVRDACWA